MNRVICIAFLAGCTANAPTPPVEPAPVSPPSVAATPKNLVFIPASGNSPRVRLLPMPGFRGAASIWGATGRDHRGHIYFGVSSEGVEPASAHLFMLNPAHDEVTDLGGAMEHLARLGLAKPGESQNKIHTKIIQAADGNLYFASMDESGENEDGSRLPTFGSHLWRLTPGQSQWQHLAHVPQAVIACAAGGQFVYFLGYYGHEIYQFDTATNRIRNTCRVGAIGGHTTRNFIADSRGHIFVPRVSAGKAELIEYDEDLHEVKAFPLEGYSRTPDASSHGIVGVAALADGGWLFTTDRGRLYRLDPRATGSTLADLGKMHPRGDCYAACLFCLDGESHVAAIANVVERGEPRYEWVTFNLKAKTATNTPREFPLPQEGRNLLLYGSFTRDDAGRCYIGGRYLRFEGDTALSVPVLWCIEP